MILDGTHQTGSINSKDDLWVTNCTFRQAGMIVEGDFYVEGPCVFDKANIGVLGNALFRVASKVDGDLNCQHLFTHEPCEFRDIYCKRIMTRGEMRFDKILCDATRLYGSCFGNVLRAQTIWIDGDLVVDTVIAEEIHVERGSLLVKNLEVKKAQADIIGNYTHERLDPTRFKFKWARPMTEGAEPKTSETHDIILNGYLVMKSCIGHIPELNHVLQKFSNFHSCSDFSSEKVAIFSDIKKHYSRLCPAAQQFIECIEEHGFPDLMWRF